MIRSKSLWTFQASKERGKQANTHAWIAFQGSDSTRSHIAYNLLTHPGAAVTIRRISNVAAHSSSIPLCKSPWRDTGILGTWSMGRFANEAKHSAAVLYTSVSGYHEGRASEARARIWLNISGRLRAISSTAVFFTNGKRSRRRTRSPTICHIS